MLRRPFHELLGCNSLRCLSAVFRRSASILRVSPFARRHVPRSLKSVSARREAVMEHRLSIRATYNAGVSIYYNRLGLLQAQAVDVRRHGMYVRTGRVVLPLHALVEIVFTQAPPGDPPLARTSAMVVRGAANGIGLMFGGEVGNVAANDSVGNTRRQNV